MHKLEVLIYFCVYILYIIYSIFSILQIRKGILKIARNDLCDGWKLFGGKRDCYNYDLEQFNDFIIIMWPWFIFHSIMIQLIRIYYPVKQAIGSSIICFTALFQVLRPFSMMIFVVLVMSFYPLKKWKSKTLIWLTHCLWILFFNMVKFIPHIKDAFDPWEIPILICILGWSLLRCTSYSIEYINSVKENKEKTHTEDMYSFDKYVGFLFHLPTVFIGPAMAYSRYIQFLKKNVEEQPCFERYKNFMIEILRHIVIWFVTMFLYHYLYISFMIYEPKFLQLIPTSFGKFGIAYFMGIFFYMYYRLVYGISAAFARLDGMDPPPVPKCVGRIHYYSDMWRTFDSGLYEFLHKYIYKEIAKSAPFKENYIKLFSMVTTFTFVYFWHGLHTEVFIWSFLNMTVIIIEKQYRVFFASKNYQRWKFSRHNKYAQILIDRFEAVIGAQIFSLAALSNIYFIANMSIGNHMIHTLFTQGVWNYIQFSFYTYCFFQCAEYLQSKLNSKK